MNGFMLFISLIVIRFFLLGLLNPEALKEAVHFAPRMGNERVAYYIYQLSNLVLLVFPFFTKVSFTAPFVFLGLFFYAIGILMLLLTTIHFARPKQMKLKTHGIYRFSRNPMYLGYFFFFLGCVCLTRSWVLLLALIFFQLATHWIILSEERWCKAQFGDAYLSYQQQVRRYI